MSEQIAAQQHYLQCGGGGGGRLMQLGRIIAIEVEQVVHAEQQLFVIIVELVVNDRVRLGEGSNCSVGTPARHIVEETDQAVFDDIVVSISGRIVLSAIGDENGLSSSICVSVCLGRGLGGGSGGARAGSFG